MSYFCNTSLTRAMYYGTKIVAIGKNYGAHIVEMGGSTAARAPRPLYFLKPSSSVIAAGEAIVKPKGIGSVHHEVELGVVIGSKAKRVSAADAMRHVSGYVVALDMTARDMQAAAKASGAPWTESKCADTFTPMSHIIEACKVPDPHALTLACYVNGELKQRGSTGDMLFRIPELIEAVTATMTLEPGDVLLTGTPSGVGPVEAGQTIRIEIEGVVEASFPVEDEK